MIAPALVEIVICRALDREVRERAARREALAVDDVRLEDRARIEQLAVAYAYVVDDGDRRTTSPR